jgi:hypothetical protein
MNPRISSYFAAVVAVVAIVVMIENLRVGLPFAIASAATVAPLYWFPVPKRYFYIPLFMTTTLWATHLTRVPVLTVAPDLFLYPRIGPVAPSVLAIVLLRYAAYSILLFLGLSLGFRAFSPRDAAQLQEHSEPKPPLVRASVVVALVCLGIFLARAILQLGLGLYTKNVTNPKFGFLSQLLPDGMLYPMTILYLAKYRRRIPIFESFIFVGIAAGMVGLTLISGSRRSIATLGLALFIYFLAYRGDFRIRFSRMILLVGSGLTLLMLSFALARPIRNYLAANGGYSGELFSVIWRGARNAFQPGAATFLANAVSRRVSLATDGMLVVEMYRPESVIGALSPVRTAQRVVAKLVPHYRPPDNALSSGKVIGMVYSGVSVEEEHAGAVGLLASFNLTFGRWFSFAAILILGMMCAAYFGITARIREPDLVYLFHFIGMQMIFSWILAGNLDGMVASTVVNFTLLSLYFFTIVIIIGAARLGTTREPRNTGVGSASPPPLGMHP